MDPGGITQVALTRHSTNCNLFPGHDATDYLREPNLIKF